MLNVWKRNLIQKNEEGYLTSLKELLMLRQKELEDLLYNFAQITFTNNYYIVNIPFSLTNQEIKRLVRHGFEVERIIAIKRHKLLLAIKDTLI
jgi:hypothetical protein